MDIIALILAVGLLYAVFLIVHYRERATLAEERSAMWQHEVIYLRKLAIQRLEQRAQFRKERAG